jgi:hypothetical protein
MGCHEPSHELLHVSGFFDEKVCLLTLCPCVTIVAWSNLIENNLWRP